MNRRLHSVPPPDKPLDMAPDIYAKVRAKRASIDWAAMHIAADRRREALPGETHKRRWWR